MNDSAELRFERRFPTVNGLAGLRTAVRALRPLARPRGAHQDVRAAVAMIRGGETDRFFNHIRRSVLGLRRDGAMATILETAARHVLGEVAHGEASERIWSAGTSLNPSRFRPEALMAAETLVRASGIFAASLPLTRLLHEEIDTRVSRGDGRYSSKAVVAAIHRGELDRAQEALARTRVREPGLERYLAVWSQRTPPQSASTRASDSVDRAFAASLASKTVLIYGPGPVTTLPEVGPSSISVIRMVMPDVYLWTSENDLMSGRSDIAYLNHEAQEWLSGLPTEERAAVVGRFSFLVCKKSDNFLQGVEHAGVRVADSASSLYLTGSENTVPAIVVDVLVQTQAKVVIIGTTFFASTLSYRDDHRRIRINRGAKVDVQGRVGGVLERCTMLASHNALENLAIVRNLYNVGLVTGDEAFTEVVALSDEQYLRRLDEIYGVDRL
jgi:hypothetical protein